MAFCNAVQCVRSSNSSVVNYKKHPSSSLKTFIRRQLFKKSSTSMQSHTPIRRSVKNHTPSNTRFQRIKGSNIVREINPTADFSFKTDSTNNYDMTVLHDDQLDDTQISLSHRRSKKIPRWARKSQLQLAFINQIYFNDQQPEDIFGTVQIDAAREMVESIDLCNTELPLVYSFTTLPPNFV